MAIGVYFDVKGMDAEKFAEVHRSLEEIGQSEPEGRTFHAGFLVGDEMKVFDVWDSPQAFEAFGGQLGPILERLNIDATDMEMGEIDRVTVTA